MQPEDEENERIEKDPAEETPENEDPVVREDKIFNNRYNSGDGLPNTEDYEFHSSISVNKDYSSEYLKDVYDYEEQIEYRIIIDRIFEIIKSKASTEKFVNKPNKSPTKVKLTKDDVNLIFTEVFKEVETTKLENSFFNPIYILEVIAAISSLEYRKIFDMLDTEIQQILLIELNKKYQFLDGKMNKKRIH